MAFDKHRLLKIFEKTDGQCHLCGKRLCWKNHGVVGARGAWEVEHSRPRAKGGTNHLVNLFAAHVSCNRAKGSGSTRSARARHGRTRAPLSASAKRDRRLGNAAAWGTGVALLARVALGPQALLAGFVLGAVLGGLQAEDE